MQNIICQYCGKIFQGSKNRKFCTECRNRPVPKPCQDGKCNCGKLVYSPLVYYAKFCPNDLKAHKNRSQAAKEREAKVTLVQAKKKKEKRKI